MSKCQNVFNPDKLTNILDYQFWNEVMDTDPWRDSFSSLILHQGLLRKSPEEVMTKICQNISIPKVAL